LYTVTKPYYDFLGVVANDITDGLLIPWVAGDVRGTFWAVAQGDLERFDMRDVPTLEALADFASIAVRQHAQQEKKAKYLQQSTAAATAHQLAHEINNPLQSLTNTVYLA